MEIQQRSAATFRLFDYDRQRPLHIDYAVAAASAEQTEHQAPLRTLTTARTLLVASPHFVLERFELPPGSNWELLALGETWLFMLDGCARIGSIEVGMGEVLFLEMDRTRIEVGTAGLRGLAAYAGSDPNPNLLHRLDGAAKRLLGADEDRIPLQPVAAPSFATKEARS
jgi:mannose-6-phosphate isomerase